MLARVRACLFLAAVLMVAMGWSSARRRWWFAGAGVALGSFFVAVVCHETVRRKLRRNGLLRQINEQALARLNRDWAALPLTRVVVPPQHRAVVADLDLFGHASLFDFVCLAHTPTGIRTLGDWLLEPASTEQIQHRQQAVRELAPCLVLRERLVLEGRLLTDQGRGTERFVEWAEGGPWLASRPWLLWLIRVLSASAALILALICSGVVPAEHGGPALLAVLLANVLVTALFGSKVHDVFTLACVGHREVAQHSTLFGLLDSAQACGAELDAMRLEVASLGGGPLFRIRQLGRIAALTMVRRSALSAILVYLPLQFMFLFDFHVLDLLEAWQRRYGRYARAWFAALGRFEALASLATMAHDYPDWAFPLVEASADRFQSRKLAHPLLPDRTRVPNDVEIGPAGSFLLVTGSNMSGKSTLLRAVGVNAVLAQAGAPVCAEHLAMPPIALATSMRIRDSLEDGVSFYMAELMRLKVIVDLARDAGVGNNPLLLYLLDEILLGTNSRERHLAVVQVLRHLLHCRAIGAVSTHDLDLATSAALANSQRCVHFCETLHGRDAEKPMTFDYRLRPGVATTTNALKLLEIVGIIEGQGAPG
jgi:hypothetical protein